MKTHPSKLHRPLLILFTAAVLPATAFAQTTPAAVDQIEPPTGTLTIVGDTRVTGSSITTQDLILGGTLDVHGGIFSLGTLATGTGGPILSFNLSDVSASTVVDMQIGRANGQWKWSLPGTAAGSAPLMSLQNSGLRVHGFPVLTSANVSSYLPQNLNLANLLGVGSVEIRCWSINNGWVGENVEVRAYRDHIEREFDVNGDVVNEWTVVDEPGGFYRKQAGSAGLYYFANGEGQMRFSASGAANTLVSEYPNLKIGADGSFGIGPGMSYVAGNYTPTQIEYELGVRPPSFRIVGSTGNVGIGTTEPQARLHVDGDARFTGTVLIPESGDISMGEFTAGPQP